MGEPSKNVRKHMRYKSDPNTVAFVAPKLKKGKFVSDQSALVLNESFKGCCLVVGANKEIAVGKTIWIQLGELDPLEAEIRWVEQLSPEVYRFGAYYLE